MKPKLSNIFNNNKSNKCAPEEVIIKTITDVEQESRTEKNRDEVISISSSDSDIMDDMSLISISSTSKESNNIFSLSLSSISNDDSSRPRVYK